MIAFSELDAPMACCSGDIVMNMRTNHLRLLIADELTTVAIATPTRSDEIIWHTAGTGGGVGHEGNPGGGLGHEGNPGGGLGHEANAGGGIGHEGNPGGGLGHEGNPGGGLGHEGNPGGGTGHQGRILIEQYVLEDQDAGAAAPAVDVLLKRLDVLTR